MEDLFATGRIADIVMVLMLVEACALFAIWKKAGKGLRPLEILTTLAAGLFLFLALRFALSGAEWPWIGAALGLALVAHVADLTSRWRNG